MAVRRVLELLRTVPDIVFAMVFVVAFGLGPLPGVLALTLHSIGTLGKQFTEVVESIDMSPVEGVAAAGGNWLSQVRFGALPQVLSNFASYTLLRMEINVRGAAVIGFVGAGGIGEDLLIAIRKFYYQDVSAMLLLLVACVMLLDMASERLRHRLLALDQPMSELRAQFPRARRPACRRRRARTAPMTLPVAGAGARHLSGGVGRARRHAGSRSLAGLGRLGGILLLMLPPSPGSAEHFWTYLGALGQTLAIAFLGTTVARRSPCRLASWPRAMSWPGASCIS